MTIQLELDFSTRYIVDYLESIRSFALLYSTATHSEKTANFPAFIALTSQLHDLVHYAFSANIIDLGQFNAASRSRLRSIDLFWGV